MVEIDAKTVMALRKKTGAPMMDCKAALTESGGNEEKAIEILRKKGLQAADARGGRDATEGQVFSYVHHNGKVGVLVEIGCETDFVARNEEFQEFGRTACLHVAAMRPAYLSQEDVDAAAIEKERKFLSSRPPSRWPAVRTKSCRRRSTAACRSSSRRSACSSRSG